MSSEDLVPNKPLWVTLSSEIISDIILENIHHTQSSSFPVENLPSNQKKKKKKFSKKFINSKKITLFHLLHKNICYVLTMYPTLFSVTVKMLLKYSTSKSPWHYLPHYFS